MRIGITGQNGFIGRNFTTKLIEDGHNVIGLQSDLLSWGFVKENYFVFDEFKDCDIIIHLAGKNHGTDKEITSTNVFGTMNLLNWCHLNNKKVIIAGSDYSKESAYKHSKDTIKMLCKSYASCTKLQTVILNFPRMVGPGCRPHYNSFITTLIYLKSKGVLETYLYLIKDMKERISIMHVSDAYEILKLYLKWLVIDGRSIQYEEYQFTKYDGLIECSFREIVDALNNKENINKNLSFLPELVKWYKENEI